jgi:uncharacterized membrane protein YuzA (DUF378 family)
MMRLRRRRVLLKKLNALDRVSLAAVCVGAINWGLVGLFNFDVVRALLGKGSKASRAAYIAVGASAAYSAVRASDLVD